MGHLLWKGTRKISVGFNQGICGGSRGITLGLQGEKLQGSETESVTTAAQERALFLCLSLLGRPSLCLLTSASQGEDKKSKSQHSNKNIFFRQHISLQALQPQSASSSVSLVFVAIKLLIVSFLMQDRLSYKMQKSHCSPHKYTKIGRAHV